MVCKESYPGGSMGTGLISTSSKWAVEFPKNFLTHSLYSINGAMYPGMPKTWWEMEENEIHFGSGNH